LEFTSMTRMAGPRFDPTVLKARIDLRVCQLKETRRLDRSELARGCGAGAAAARSAAASCTPQ